MPADLWKILIDGASLGLTMVVGIYAWATARARAAKEDMDRIADRVDQLERDMTVVQHDIDQLPTHSELQKMSDRLGDLHGDMKGLREGVIALTKTVDRMNDYLMQRPQ